MPELNTHHRMPAAALWYNSLGSIAMSLLVLAVGLFLGTSRVLAENCDGSCIAGGVALALGTAVVILMVLAYPVLYYLLFYYEISEHSISVNSGIIFKEYETIHRDRIQTVDNERGPLLWLFGLSEMRIWTVSPDQFPGADHVAHADTTILLRRDDAEALKSYLMQKSGHSS